MLGTTLFNYAAKGGMIAAGGGMLLISLASAAGLLHQPTSERLLIVLGNYFLTKEGQPEWEGREAYLKQFKLD